MSASDYNQVCTKIVRRAGKDNYSILLEIRDHRDVVLHQKEYLSGYPLDICRAGVRTIMALVDLTQQRAQCTVTS